MNPALPRIRLDGVLLPPPGQTGAPIVFSAVQFQRREEGRRDGHRTAPAEVLTELVIVRFGSLRPGILMPAA